MARFCWGACSARGEASGGRWVYGGSLPDSAENQIARIVGNFDFERVRAVMVALNWSWINVGVPSVADLVESALVLLRGLEPGSGHGCGGFYAQCSADGIYSLAFVVTDQDGEYWSDATDNAA